MITRPIHSATMIACAFLSTALPAISQSLSYQFNDAGQSSENMGTEGGSFSLNLYDINGNAADLHSEKGTGVSGGEDKALNLSTATKMGGKQDAPGSGPVVSNRHAGRIFNSASAFTVTGWFKADLPPDDAARLLNADGKNGARLFLSQNMILQIGDDTMVSRKDTDPKIDQIEGPGINYARSKDWTFFAVTYAYDASTNKSRICFYKGTPNKLDPLNSFIVTYNPTTPIPLGCSELFIGGNGKPNARPFRGLFDSFRVYVSRDDRTGALSPDDIDKIRINDLEGVK